MAGMRIRMIGAVFAVMVLGGGTVSCGEGSGSDSSKEDPSGMTPAEAVAKAAEKSKKLGGKSWFRADRAVWGRGAVDNNSYGMLPSQIEGSPAVQSTILTGSKDVRKIGSETIDGTRTTHYRGTVIGSGLHASRDAAADKATRERRIESLDGFMALRIDDTLTMDLWIDNDNRAKQFRMRGETYDTRGGAEGEPLDFTEGDPLDMTVTFLDINQPVTVEVPSAEDTADLAELADDAQEG